MPMESSDMMLLMSLSSVVVLLVVGGVTVAINPQLVSSLFGGSKQQPPRSFDWNTYATGTPGPTAIPASVVYTQTLPQYGTMAPVRTTKYPY